MTSTARKVLDWRLPFCIALLGLVLYIIVTGLGDARESREKSARIDALIAQSDHLNDVAERERASASAERQRLLDGQRRLESQYQRLVAQQFALLEYLREHGIDIPTEFTTRYVAPAPKHHTSKHQSTPQKSTTSQPPAVSSPPKAGPGRAHQHGRKPPARRR